MSLGILYQRRKGEISDEIRIKTEKVRTQSGGKSGEKEQGENKKNTIHPEGHHEYSLMISGKWLIQNVGMGVFEGTLYPSPSIKKAHQRETRNLVSGFPSFEGKGNKTIGRPSKNGGGGPCGGS